METIGLSASAADTSRTALRAARVAGWLLAGAALAGCAVGPQYQQPRAALPAHYQGEALLAARPAAGQASALDTWWNGFHDPALTRIIERVLAQNLDLAASLARVDQARAVARHAGAARLPQGSLDTQVLKQRQSIEGPLGKLASGVAPDYDRNQTIYAGSVGASWEADLAGGLARGAEAAGAEAQAAEADHMGVRISVAADAADAYFHVRGAQARIAVAQQQIASSTNVLRLVDLRMQSGLATSRERAQADALVYQARATVPPLRAELAAQLNRLDVLMGAAPGTYARELAQPGTAVSIPAIAVDDGPANLLRRRPDVIAAERRLAASSANIGVATAEYYPKLSLAALLGFESLDGGQLFTSGGFQPQARAGLRWRLFDFGRVDAEVAHAQGAYAAALAGYRQAMLRATEDVENAVVTLVQREAQSDELAKEIAAHQQARDASQEAYAGGAVSLVEVLDEDRLLLTARDRLALAQTDQARAAVATFRSLGGGW